MRNSVPATEARNDPSSRTGRTVRLVILGKIRELFPGIPVDIDRQIAEFACGKHSRRVGRSVAAKALEEQAVRLAVAAYIRHTETVYDSLLGAGTERETARPSGPRPHQQRTAELGCWIRRPGTESSGTFDLRIIRQVIKRCRSPSVADTDFEIHRSLE